MRWLTLLLLVAGCADGPPVDGIRADGGFGASGPRSRSLSRRGDASSSVPTAVPTRKDAAINGRRDAPPPDSGPFRDAADDAKRQGLEDAFAEAAASPSEAGVSEAGNLGSRDASVEGAPAKPPPCSSHPDCPAELCPAGVKPCCNVWTGVCGCDPMYLSCEPP